MLSCATTRPDACVGRATATTAFVRTTFRARRGGVERHTRRRGAAARRRHGFVPTSTTEAMGVEDRVNRLVRRSGFVRADPTAEAEAPRLSRAASIAREADDLSGEGSKSVEEALEKQSIVQDDDVDRVGCAAARRESTRVCFRCPSSKTHPVGSGRRRGGSRDVPRVRPSVACAFLILRVGARGSRLARKRPGVTCGGRREQACRERGHEAAFDRSAATRR